MIFRKLILSCTSALVACVAVGRVEAAAPPAAGAATTTTAPVAAPVAGNSRKADAFIASTTSMGKAVTATGVEKGGAVALVEESQRPWKAEFQPTADAAVTKRVNAAFAAAKKAAARGSVFEMKMQEQIVEKGMLAQVIPDFERALRAKKTEAASQWAQVYVVNFGWDTKPGQTFAAMKGAIAAPEPANVDSAVAFMRRHMSGAVISEVKDAAEEVEKKALEQAQIFAAEGRLYFQAFESDFQKRMNKGDGARLSKALDDALAGAKAGDAARVKSAHEIVSTSITAYQTRLGLAPTAPPKK